MEALILRPPWRSLFTNEELATADTRLRDLDLTMNDDVRPICRIDSLRLRIATQMEPWYKSVQPRAEVREGRSFNPDEFAIALEQVAAGNAPDDYKDPVKVFRPHLLHSRVERTRRNGAPAPFR